MRFLMTTKIKVNLQEYIFEIVFVRSTFLWLSERDILGMFGLVYVFVQPNATAI